MKYLKRKESKNIVKVIKNELMKNILKYFIINSFFQFKKGFFIYPKKLLYKADLLSYNKNKIKTRCYLSNRGRGMINFYKISRSNFKEQASYGYLTGLRKSSW